jgi:hypothetical protein
MVKTRQRTDPELLTQVVRATLHSHRMHVETGLLTRVKDAILVLALHLPSSEDVAAALRKSTNHIKVALAQHRKANEISGHGWQLQQAHARQKAVAAFKGFSAAPAAEPRRTKGRQPAHVPPPPQPPQPVDVALELHLQKWFDEILEEIGPPQDTAAQVRAYVRDPGSWQRSPLEWERAAERFGDLLVPYEDEIARLQRLRRQHWPWLTGKA